jgi:hypothetical protein
MAGQGSHGPAIATRPRQLPRCAHAPTGVAFEETVLKQKQVQAKVKKIRPLDLNLNLNLKLGGYHGGVFVGALVFHEGAEKVLASADYPLFGSIGWLGGLYFRLRRRPFHLHLILESKQ